jgi:hypothetical protein
VADAANVAKKGLMPNKVYMATTRIRASFCPHCFHVMDAATNVYGDSPPASGDFTVCIDCGSVLSFDENMQLMASSLAASPIEIRSKLAGIKMCIEEARRPWNEKGGKPWCSR